MAADTGMDTCPSPEISDSRKRPLDGDSENGDIKRGHFSSGEYCLFSLHQLTLTVFRLYRNSYSQQDSYQNVALISLTYLMITKNIVT